ncbi:hypothetical protein ACH4TX_18085 [Streptomyces sp. NPDC021098]|uniref:hypothetical protein n=1 Tax=unclassified Streptomyces TaxID=2593676 RepID=UPI0037ABAD92
MQTNTDKRSARAELLPVAAGAAVGIAATGAALALADFDSPLRAPFTLFFLVVAPAAALGSALRGLDAAARTVLGVAGALALDLLVAQTMLALHIWSVRGGVAAVGVLSLLILSPALLPRARRTGRGAPGRERAEPHPGGGC